jgi:hypothetical protein
MDSDGVGATHVPCAEPPLESSRGAPEARIHAEGDRPAGRPGDQEGSHVRFDRRLLGWGLFLIIVGAIPLLVRGGYVGADQIRGWPSLWPLLLIGWGLGLVLRRTPGELIGSAVSVVVFGVMVGGLIATGFGGFPAFGACGGDNSGTAFDGRFGTLGATGRANIEFNCGTLTVGTADGSDWSIRGTGPDGRGPDIESTESRVSFRERNDSFTGFFDRGSEWLIDLPRTPTLSLGVTLNAGEGTADLSGASLDSLGVTLNAGSITFDLADTTALSNMSATVNAGSAAFNLPGTVTDASLTLNAGSIEVCLPAGTPVRVSWSGVVGSNNFDAAGLTKIDDQHWESGSGQRLDLSVSANAGSFTLNYGGSCHA